MEIEQRHYTSLVEQLSEQEEKVEDYKNNAAKVRLAKEQQANRMEVKRWESAKTWVANNCGLQKWCFLYKKDDYSVNAVLISFNIGNEYFCTHFQYIFLIYFDLQ